MLALAVLEARRCSGCGGDLDVTTDGVNEGRYQVTEIIRCHQCDVIGAAADAHEKAGAPRMHAVRFRTRLIAPTA